MKKQHVTFLIIAVALAVVLAFFVREAKASQTYRTNIVVNDYVYDTYGVEWINVNTFNNRINCSRAARILFSLVQGGFEVEYTGPASCPYSIWYGVYHGRYTYHSDFYSTYGVRFNNIHTNLWINGTPDRRHFRPYYQSTIRTTKVRVKSRTAKRMQTRYKWKTSRWKKHRANNKYKQKHNRKGPKAKKRNKVNRNNRYKNSRNKQKKYKSQKPRRKNSHRGQRHANARRSR